jgi:cholesterol transport system auxiliary component
MSPARLLAAATVLALAGCGGILPKPPPPPALYRLTPLDAAGTPARGVNAQLAVELPTASTALDSERIALMRSPLSFDYFADAAWTDHAPEMVQSLLINSLQNAGQIRVVARASGQLREDAALSCDLRRFEARYDGDGPPQIDAELECRIVSEPDRNVLAVRRFEGTSRPSANDMPAIVEGFDAALHDALASLVPWTADTLAAAKR